MSFLPLLCFHQVEFGEVYMVGESANIQHLYVGQSVDKNSAVLTRLLPIREVIFTIFVTDCVLFIYD